MADHVQRQLQRMSLVGIEPLAASHAICCTCKIIYDGSAQSILHAAWL